MPTEPDATEPDSFLPRRDWLNAALTLALLFAPIALVAALAS